MHKPRFLNSFNLKLSSIGGIVFDKDGLLIDSEPHLIKNVLDAVKIYLAFEDIPTSLLEKLHTCFGQTHLKMCRDFFEVITSAGYEVKEDRNQWPDIFTDICKSNWEEVARAGKISWKPGVANLFSQIRKMNTPTAMYTGTIRQMADIDIDVVMQARDLFKEPFIITSDDMRVSNVEKSDPTGWSLMANEINLHYEVNSENMLGFEDRASGALGALRAGFKFVIVIPDPNDAPSNVDPMKFDLYWDKKGLIKKHLESNPNDLGRLVFLRSLEDLIFS